MIVLSGHVNFSDEVTAAFRLCDGVVIFIDAAEGVRSVYGVLIYLFNNDKNDRVCSLTSNVDRAKMG